MSYSSTLSAGKCNIWRAHTKAATAAAHWQDYCVYPRVRNDWNAMVTAYLAINPQYK